MTETQKKWLDAHPEFKLWYQQPIVSIRGWTDIGWLTSEGDIVGEPTPVPGMPGAFSLGDTLYAPGALHLMKIGREFDIV